MSFRKRPSRIRFSTKIVALFVICLALLMTAAALTLNQRIDEQVAVEGRNKLNTAARVFNFSEKERERNFLLRFQSLPNEPRWRAVFQNADPATVRGTLRDLIREQGVHVAMFTSMNPEKGLVAAEMRDPTLSVSAFATSAAPSVRAAMLGENRTDTVQVGDRLYDVVSIPSYNPAHDQVYGVLTLGAELGQGVANDFSQLTHSEIALVANGQVMASTLQVSGVNDQLVELFKAGLRPTEGDPPGLPPVMLGGEHYFVTSGSLTSLNRDVSLGYVLLSSYEESLAAARATQKVLLGVCLGAVLLGAVLVWVFVKRFTRPLGQLYAGAEAVGRGDFSTRVEVKTRDEFGDLAGAFNQMTDNLRQSRTELEQTVETLKTTQNQLVQREKLSAVGEFVAGVAHELNNPLTAVMGFSEMLKDADVDTKHKRYLEMIFKSAQRCQKIVQALLSFARRRQPERKPVSVNSLIEAVLEMVAYQLRTSNVEVVTQFDPALPLVLADSHQVQQVVLNIINNARQAMEGHVEQGRITILTEHTDEHIRIVIRDNGPGIAPENLPRIFDPFFTTKQVGQGTGLGLSLCYGLIREHGGNIIPISRPGEGATFIIELPVAAELIGLTETLPAAEPEKANAREGEGRRILVIDDEETLLQIVHDGLSRNGYRVDTVADGETALHHIAEHDYDAIFCDWKMPGLNGQQVYERQHMLNPEVCRRFIFVTGDVVNDRLQLFLEKENLPSLAKPFKIDELRAFLRKLFAAGTA